MHEIFFLVTALVGIGLLGYLITIITPQLFFSIGLFMLAAGLGEGIPTGFWYHVVLRRILLERGNLPHQSHPPAPGAFSPARPEPAETGSWPVGRPPSRWWIHPTRFHAQLTPEEYRRIRPWFVLGGVGYAIALAGGLAAIVGLLIQRL